MTMRNTLLNILILIPLLIYISAENFSLAQEPQEEMPRPIIDGTLRRIRVPILMYHYISEFPEDADEIRTNLTVTPTVFHQQMETLANLGYTTVSLYEMNQALENGTPLPENPVVLTFDDGHIDHYATVYPILQQFGFTATFFIITNFADNNEPGYMTWGQIQEMAAAGMSMEPHTKTHSDLRNRSYDFLVYEIVGSLESLAHHTNISPQIFSYPAGRYDDHTLTILETTPILRAVTTQPGTFQTTDNRLEMPRMRVTNQIGSNGLISLLRYDR